jgi:phospholipid/cholesterol/gamma-HCH transport system substrate-binding protein
VSWLSRLTTLAVTVAVAAGLALIIRARIPSNAVAGGFRTYAQFRDGARLAPGSAVVIAGVRVGTIANLTIEGSYARVDMQLQDGLDLPVGSFATRRADSLFGDSYVEIIPAAGEDGADTAQRMRSGDPIAHVIEGGSTDALLRGIGTALPKIDSALDSVHDAVITGRTWVGGPLTDRLGGADGWLAGGHVEAPIEAAGRGVGKLDDATARAAAAIADARPRIRDALARADDAITTARGKMQGAKTGLAGALRDARDGLDELDPKIAQAAELMAAIDDGHASDWRGTLGHLINDGELGETLDDVTGDVRAAASGLNRFKSWLGARVEYDAYSGQVRFYATAELRAHTDKFYLIELERGPLGGAPSDALSDVVNSGSYVRTQVLPDTRRFTLQFGKQLGSVAVRGGIKDSTFGVGGDAWLFADRLRLSADVYGAFATTPRVKLASALAVFRAVYVMVGVDDALNRPGYLSIVTGAPGAPKTFDQVRYGRDYFAGAMLQFTDEDLSVLLRVYGAALAGLL